MNPEEYFKFDSKEDEERFMKQLATKYQQKYDEKKRY
jgi:hypothetical protein